MEKENENKIKMQSIENDLRNENPRIRTTALDYLGKNKMRGDLIVSSFKDPNSYVRVAAIKALGKFLPEDLSNEQIDIFSMGLDDPNKFVCQETIRSITYMRTKKFNKQLVELLNDKNAHIVTEAMTAIKKLRIEESSDQLIQLLSSSNYYILVGAISAVAFLGINQAEPIILKLLKEYYDVSKDKKSTLILRELVIACGNLKISNSIGLLIAIAKNKVGLRGKAVYALLQLEAFDAAPALIELLSDPSKKLRTFVIILLTKANYREALPLIRPYLDDPIPYIRKASLIAINNFNDELSIDKVKDMAFEDRNPFNRILAVDVLVSLLKEKCYPYLVELLNDTNSEIRNICEKKILEFGKKFSDKQYNRDNAQQTEKDQKSIY